jgi:UDP-GlcNAc3NAcA epimerase
MKKIVTVVGARPQFIKAATLSRQFKLLEIDEKIIHTGQHFEANMSDIFFTELDIPKPSYQLDIHNLSHGAMTGRMLEGIERILLAEKPDGVLVYGDTNSTLAGALAASKLHIPVIHVEAGLRSFNMEMSEEINRILTDRMSRILFCPTESAVRNLKNEGFDHLPVTVFNSGDVMKDAALYYTDKAQLKSDILRKIGVKKFVLATIHRQENTNSRENLRNIVAGLNEIHKLIPVVVPLHPRTRRILAQQYILPDFITIDPVGYFDMISLLKNCELVITDSGGLQKEAFFLKKHCITLRNETEWVELIENGLNTLVGSDKLQLKKAFELFLTKTSNFDIDLYGNGHAARFMAETIKQTNI